MAASRLSVRPADWARDQHRCLAIRRQVFIAEQQIPASIEIDGRDPDCHHALASLGDTDVGTGRLLPDGRIGRVAVLAAHRSQGIGQALMHCLMTQARALGHVRVHLAAQDTAIRFYHQLGFRDDGAPFYEAGILHQAMHFDFDD